MVCVHEGAGFVFVKWFRFDDNDSASGVKRRTRLGSSFFTNSPLPHLHCFDQDIANMYIYRACIILSPICGYFTQFSNKLVSLNLKEIEQTFIMIKPDGVQRGLLEKSSADLRRMVSL